MSEGTQKKPEYNLDNPHDKKIILEFEKELKLAGGWFSYCLKQKFHLPLKHKPWEKGAPSDYVVNRNMIWEYDDAMRKHRAFERLRKLRKIAKEHEKQSGEGLI